MKKTPFFLFLLVYLMACAVPTVIPEIENTTFPIIETVEFTPIPTPTAETQAAVAAPHPAR